MTFALIDNLSELKSVDSSTDETIAEFTRTSVAEILKSNGNKSSAEIGENENVFAQIY